MKTINSSFIVLAGFIACLISVIFLKNLSLKRKSLLLQGIPRIGGISIGLAFIVISLFSFISCKMLSQQVTGIILASSAMLLFGLIDDLREFSVGIKFLVQVVATSILVLFGIKTHIVYIGNILNTVITFIWIIGITNSFNHLDITDGLAAGVALIVGFAFFTVSLLKADINSVIISLSLIGPTAAFLVYNWPPARVYMGNSGSHFLGFILAALALLISYAPLERKIALLSPILILWLPILDTAALITIRLIKKNMPFKKSNDHLVLKLLASGYPKAKALILMLAFGLFFSGCGVFISSVPNKIGSLILAATLGASLLLVKITQKLNANA